MTDDSTGQDEGYLRQTTDIVVAYLGNNTVKAGDIAGIVQPVYGCLATLATDAVAAQQKLEPAVPIKKSVAANYVVCLEDGPRWSLFAPPLTPLRF